jgi:hypothetical protein
MNKRDWVAADRSRLSKTKCRVVVAVEDAEVSYDRIESVTKRFIGLFKVVTQIDEQGIPAGKLAKWNGTTRTRISKGHVRTEPACSAAKLQQ